MPARLCRLLSTIALLPCVRYLDRGLEPGQIAVNVRGLGATSRTKASSARVRASPRALRPRSTRLELEVTENVTARPGSGEQDTPRPCAALHAPRRHPSRSTYFGTGYASLAHLKRFPVDRPDRSTIYLRARQMHGVGRDAAIAHATSSTWAHSQGMELGTRRESRRARSSSSCACTVATSAQGYVISRPLLGIDAVARFLETRARAGTTRARRREGAAFTPPGSSARAPAPCRAA